MTPGVKLFGVISGIAFGLTVVGAVFVFVSEDYRYWAMIALLAVSGAMYPVILKYDKRHGRSEDGGDDP